MAEDKTFLEWHGVSKDKIKSNKPEVITNNSLPFFIAGGLMGITAIGCPCPVCIGSAVSLIFNGIREKLINR